MISSIRDKRVLPRSGWSVLSNRPTLVRLVSMCSFALLMPILGISLNCGATNTTEGLKGFRIEYDHFPDHPYGDFVLIKAFLTAVDLNGQRDTLCEYAISPVPDFLGGGMGCFIAADSNRALVVSIDSTKRPYCDTLFTCTGEARDWLLEARWFDVHYQKRLLTLNRRGINVGMPPYYSGSIVGRLGQIDEIDTVLIWDKAGNARFSQEGDMVLGLFVRRRFGPLSDPSFVDIAAYDLEGDSAFPPLPPGPDRFRPSAVSRTGPIYYYQARPRLRRGIYAFEYGSRDTALYVTTTNELIEAFKIQGNSVRMRGTSRQYGDIFHRHTTISLSTGAVNHSLYETIPIEGWRSLRDSSCRLIRAADGLDLLYLVRFSESLTDTLAEYPVISIAGTDFWDPSQARLITCDSTACYYVRISTNPSSPCDTLWECDIDLRPYLRRIIDVTPNDSIFAVLDECDRPGCRFIDSTTIALVSRRATECSFDTLLVIDSTVDISFTLDGSQVLALRGQSLDSLSDSVPYAITVYDLQTDDVEVLPISVFQRGLQQRAGPNQPVYFLGSESGNMDLWMYDERRGEVQLTGLDSLEAGYGFRLFPTRIEYLFRKRENLGTDSLHLRVIELTDGRPAE